MKRNLLSFVCLLLVGLVVGCQEVKKEEANAVKPAKVGAARRCPGNLTSYSFIKPDDDYGYNGDGCQSFFVHRGTTRSFKVKMANTTSYAQNITIRIDHPDNPSLLNYSVGSFTGGTISFGSPVPGTSFGAYIQWSATSVPAFTTYELVLNITGGTSGSPGAENGIQLTSVAPCDQAASSDCDSDDRLHVILAN